MVIKLDLPEFDAAVGAARGRMLISAGQGLDHATTYKRGWLRRLDEEIVGVCGEIALAKYLGVYFTPSVNTFHQTPDCHGYEVRATVRKDGRLILRDNDPPDRRYVLAILEKDTVRLAGHILGKAGMKDGWRRNPNGYRPAWFIPQGALSPMKLLQEHRSTK